MTTLELVPVDVDARTAEVERQVAEARAKAEAMRVSNDAELGAAATLLREFASRKKAADELRKELTKPLRDHLADLKKRFDDAAAPYDEADGVLRDKVKRYQTEQERIREAEEARLEAERQERERVAREDREKQEAEARAKREQAEREQREAEEEQRKAKDAADAEAAEKLAEEARQKAAEAQTAEAAIASLPEPTLPKAVVPAASKPEGVSTRKRWKVKSIAVDQLPSNYILPNEKAINESMRAGVREGGKPFPIPGVEFEQVDELAVRA